MTLSKSRKKSIILLCFVALFTGLIVTLSIIRTIPSIAEWWSANISKWWVVAVGRVSDLVPFSIFEFFIIGAVIVVIMCLIAGIAGLAKRKFSAVLNGALALTLAVLVIANIYTITAGFNYYRAEIPLPYSKTEITLASATDMYEHYVQDFNALGAKLDRDSHGNVTPPYSARDLNSRIASEYAKIDDPYFYKYTPRPKPIANSWFMTDIAILGITFLPTAEVNYNTKSPVSDIPHTITHELAHAKGVMREGDANMLASYILLNSTDDYLRYCGYFYDIYSIRYIVDMLAQSANIKTEDLHLTPIAPEILKEIDASYDFWLNQDSVFNTLSVFFNDIYLKLNGAINGSGSYNDNGDIVDSGEVDSDGKPIFNVTLSRTERMYFHIFEQSLTNK